VKPRASVCELSRLCPVVDRGSGGVSFDRGDGVLRARFVDVHLCPPDEVAARPEVRPVAAGRADDLKVSHFWLLTLSVGSYSSRGVHDVEARGDSPGPSGRHHPFVVDSAGSRLLLTANWRPRLQTGPPPFLGGVSETASETPLSAGWTPSSAASRHDVPQQEGDDDDGRRNCDHGDCGGGHEHAALISLLLPRETLSRERCGSRSDECQRQPRENREVGVELDARKTANAERCQSIVVFQVAKRALGGGPATVEVAEALRVTRDAREQTPADADRQDWLLPLDAAQRDNRIAAAFFALGVDAAVIESFVHRARLRTKATSVQGVEKRSYEVRFVTPRCCDLPSERQAGRRVQTASCSLYP
jgi:hypothetical protein